MAHHDRIAHVAPQRAPYALALSYTQGPRYGENWALATKELTMIRKLGSGQYRLYARKPDPQTGKRRNLGTFDTREQAEKHEREVQYFKRHE